MSAQPIPLIHMTRDRANEILRLWKFGLESFPARVINLALYVTGDLRRIEGQAC